MWEGISWSRLGISTGPGGWPVKMQALGDAYEQEFCWNNRKPIVICIAAATKGSDGALWPFSDGKIHVPESLPPRASKQAGGVVLGRSCPATGATHFALWGFGQTTGPGLGRSQWMQAVRPCPAVWTKTWFWWMAPNCRSFFFRTACCSETKLWLPVANYWSVTWLLKLVFFSTY